MENELEQLGERIAEQAAHLDAATHRLLADLRAFDTRGGWRAQGAASCAHWLAWRVGWDLVTARDHVRVAQKLAGFPAIDDALRRGEVSYSKVRAMLRVATVDNEVLLLEHAKLMTASQLEKLCRKYALVLRHGEGPHPKADEQRRSVLDRLLDEVEALRGADEMAHDAVSDLCDAGVELGAGEAAQCSSEAAIGRREASSLRDRGVAARRAFKRADGLVAVAHGYLRGDRPERAPSEVVLTIPASSLRAGATLDPVEVGEMGESFLSSETARRLSCDAGVVDVAERGWPQIRAANAPLQIDADTIAGPWHGTPVDYGRIVGHLCAVDGLA